MKRRASRAFRGFKRIARRSNKKYGGEGLMPTLLSGAIYGAARAPVASAVSSLSSKLPFTGYNDEVAMAVLSYGLMKFGPSGVIKNVGKVGLAVEVASLASQMSQGVVSSASSSNSLFIGGY